MGRLGTLKPTVQTPNSPKLPSKDLSIICLSLLRFCSISFLSRDAYDRALGRDVINDCADVGVSLEKEV